MLKLHNTLTRNTDPFEPLNPPQVTMYNCGPTVYDYVHIGNLRSYVFADILRRTLEWNNYEVTQVINITDVGHLTSDADTGDDKMTRGLKREGLPVTIEAMKKLADIYTNAFLDDLDALNITRPEHLPRATEHIKEQIEIIEGLKSKGFTYQTSDGVYFDTTKDPEYGKLAQLGKYDENHARVETNTEKKNPRDFALWKFNESLGWKSPWGMGFPGWHIECSAMSMKYLGETFDIHTGGIDHIPVHHTNEIAQSENYTGKPFAHYWLHNAFITVNEDKMAKSAGTGITRLTLEEKGFSSLAYRYLLLTAHYRTPLSFSWNALEASENALKRLRNRIQELPEGGSVDDAYKERFEALINDDLNTPQALALIWDLLKDTSVADTNKRATILLFNTILGLSLEIGMMPDKEIPQAIQELAHRRELARKAQDFARADKLRHEIEAHGFSVRDSDSGPHITSQ